MPLTYEHNTLRYWTYISHFNKYLPIYTQEEVCKNTCRYLYKCPFLLPDHNQNRNVLTNFGKNFPTSNFMKICSGVPKLYMGRQMDGHGKANMCLFATLHSKCTIKIVVFLNNGKQSHVIILWFCITICFGARFNSFW